MSYTEMLLNKRSRLSWVDETSYGVGGNMATDGEVIGLNAVIEPDFNQNWIEILNDGTTDITVASHEKGPLTLPFNLTFTPVDYKFLKYLGYTFTNTVSGDYFIHTGTLQQVLQSFKLEWAINHTTPVVITLTGCGVTSGTINFAKGTGEDDSMIKVTLSCVAQDRDIGSTITTLANGNITRSPLHFRHVKITQNNNEIVEVNSGDITFDRGIDPSRSRYCNSTLDRLQGELIPTLTRFSGTYDINIKDSTQFTLWNDGNKISNCKLELIKGTNDYMSFGLDGLVIRTGIPSVALEDVMNVPVAWKCEKLSPIEGKDELNTY
jgi:hypothetical protein